MTALPMTAHNISIPIPNLIPNSIPILIPTPTHHHR